MPIDDSTRPPVLAHRRFVADRQSFAGLTLRQRFQRIHDTNLWGAAKSVSGLGSEFDATATLRAELPDLLKRLGASSLLDAPCGDAGWIADVDLGVRVTGIDIVPELIERLRARAARGEIKGDYHLADITADPLPRCDAILCRDCLVHLSFANIAPRVAEFPPLRRGLADHHDLSGVADQRRLRGRRLARAEFRACAVSIGVAPAELLNENCMEAGGGWRDKSLGVWRL